MLVAFDQLSGGCCRSRRRPMTSRSSVAFSLNVALAFYSLPAAAGDASGAMSYQLQANAIEVKFNHAYLVKGPDDFDPHKTIKRIVLSATDIASTIQQCRAMNCAEARVTEGMTVDIDGGRRLNYWIAVKEGHVQYSGTQRSNALKTTANEAGRLAGSLSFDGTPAGGPRVDVEFDASLLKEFQFAR